MFFSKAVVLFSLVASSLAAPCTTAPVVVVSAADNTTTTTPATGDTLTFRTYAQFQISDGVAGKALDEVNTAFPVCISLPPFSLSLCTGVWLFESRLPDAGYCGMSSKHGS
jgi:hypothetical protein